jgi:hypothetical protein
MHLFEFNDAPWLPWPIRKTLFETMEMCNTYFRRFDREVAQQAIALATHHNLTTIVEMGAGHAPVTRALLELEESTSCHVILFHKQKRTLHSQRHTQNVFSHDTIPSTQQRNTHGHQEHFSLLLLRFIMCLHHQGNQHLPR